MAISFTGEILINFLLLACLFAICLLGEWISEKSKPGVVWLSFAGFFVLITIAIFLQDWVRVGILTLGLFLELLWFRQAINWASEEILLTLGISAFSGTIAIALQAFLFSVLLDKFPSGTQNWGLTAWGMPLLLQTVTYLVLEDLKRYSFHRLDHSSKFFWRFHKIHHGVTKLNCITGSRDHPVFNLGHWTSDIGLAYLLGVTPTALALGLSIRMVFGGILPHFNVDFPNTTQTFPWWAYLIATPNFHAWHHTLHCRPNANLADVFPFWDVLFGTFEKPRGSSRDWQFGLNDSEQLPPSIVGQLAAPFRRVDELSQTRSM